MMQVYQQIKHVWDQSCKISNEDRIAGVTVLCCLIKMVKEQGKQGQSWGRMALCRVCGVLSRHLCGAPSPQPPSRLSTRGESYGFFQSGEVPTPQLQ